MKAKFCRYCSRELTEESERRKRQCISCAVKRMQHWAKLQAEAKRKFDEEWA